jgi:hypothetical protein
VRHKLADPPPSGTRTDSERELRRLTGAVREARVAKARRDRPAMKLHPDDIYNLTPRSVAELHPMMPDLLASWEEVRFVAVRERYGM